MHVDKTTLHDLSIFHHDEEQSVFHHLNFTHTNGGKEHLRSLLSNPLHSIQTIQDVQKTISALMNIADQWPANITNGTLMVIEKFFETPTEPYPRDANYFSSLYYKIFNNPDYSITKYSVQHFIEFVKGLQKITRLIAEPTSVQLDTWKTKMELFLSKPFIIKMLDTAYGVELLPAEVLTYALAIRAIRNTSTELMNTYCQIDAHLSLAIASKEFNFNFPIFEEAETPFFEAINLFHVQLADPISYSIDLNNKKNFLFLTGANMAGKSTFIKALGVSVYLAHIGMAVPAKAMRLSLFDGILSNIQVTDNVLKGESFFFNEVQRIKSMVEKISDGKKWLILIDELFKGTNQQDAVKCSITVIEGLRKMKNALFVLSTHLYEISEQLKRYPNIQFCYFETSVLNDQLVFSYQLKEGISNDRLGYLILRKEGVVEMLQNL